MTSEMNLALPPRTRRWVRLWRDRSSAKGFGFYLNQQDPLFLETPLWQELRLSGVTGFILQDIAGPEKWSGLPLDSLRRRLKEYGFEVVDDAEFTNEMAISFQYLPPELEPLGLLKGILQHSPKNHWAKGRKDVIEPVTLRGIDESRIQIVREIQFGPSGDSRRTPQVSILLPFSRRDLNWTRVVENLAVVYQDVVFEVICLLNGPVIENLPSLQERKSERQVRRRQRREGIRLRALLNRTTQGNAHLRWVELDLRFPHFAAGICRNWGAGMARAENLLFLDSDMLIPSSYRPWLKPESVSMCCRQDVESESFKPLVMEKYWQDFNLRGEALLQQSNGWKYLCTHSLAVSRKLFFAVGGFAWSFQDYGHEDTEWAYRYWQWQDQDQEKDREKEKDKDAIPPERPPTLPERRVNLHAEPALHLRQDQEANPLSRRSALQRTGLLMLLMHPNPEVARFVQYLWGWPFRVAKKRMEIVASANSFLSLVKPPRIGTKHGGHNHNPRSATTL